MEQGPRGIDPEALMTDEQRAAMRAKTESKQTAEGTKELAPTDFALIKEETAFARDLLQKNAENPYGLLYTSGDPNSQYYEELWGRDVGLGMISAENQQAVINTLDMFFKNQRKSDGALPCRVELPIHEVRSIPIPAIRENPKFKHKEWTPRFGDKKHMIWYPEASPSRDITLGLILASGDLYRSSDAEHPEGRQFIQENYENIKRALDSEKQKYADPEDGLIKGEGLQDWCDSILRKGKLAYVNALYYRAHREIGFMASQMGREHALKAKEFDENSEEYKAEMVEAERYQTEAAQYKSDAAALKEKFMERFWDEEKGYIKAQGEDDRMDVPANVLASLYMLNSEQMIRVQENIAAKASTPCGLIKNFDRPYPDKMIAGRYKVGNIIRFHDGLPWQWVFNQNILAKLRIAEVSNDPEVQERFRKEAVADLATTSRITKQNGDFVELVNPDTGKPIKTWLQIAGKITEKGPQQKLYSSSHHFLGSYASHILAEKGCEKAGLIPQKYQFYGQRKNEPIPEIEAEPAS